MRRWKYGTLEKRDVGKVGCNHQDMHFYVITVLATACERLIDVNIWVQYDTNCTSTGAI